ncbi:MAG TPA: hypothetical protein VNA14_05575 [Mycobacteriales bacterium]|nr:hypothetical protein [Mycobacteriales bacterium]
MTELKSCIVACTDDTGRYVATVAKAGERARDSGASVILYDVAAPSTLTDPRPNIWAGEGEREVYDHPLNPVELEKLGRHDFATQVEQLREQGVDAYGWLPQKGGGAALADYAAQQGANLVLVPSSLDEPDYLTAVSARTNENLQVEVV